MQALLVSPDLRAAVHALCAEIGTELARIDGELDRGDLAFDSGTLEGVIEKDLALGRTHNLTQTPTMQFYARGQSYPYAGQISYEFLKQFLDQLLAQK